MKLEETVVIPAQEERTETKSAGAQCDLCGKEYRDARWAGHGVVWHTEESCRDITSIYMKESFNNEWETWGTTTKADICFSCFEDKVIPTLEGLGVSFRKEDYG